MGARDEVAKERCMEVYIEEKRMVKRCLKYLSKKDVNEHFGRKINQDVDGNRKFFFWKEAVKVNKGKVKSCSRIKDGNGRLALGEKELKGLF